MCLEIPDLFLMSNMIPQISRSTLEINLVFPRTDVLFSIYIVNKSSGIARKEGGGGRVLSVILIIDFDIFLNLKGKVWGGGVR